jgi:predicted DNA-binding transcriptional regulator AlpA
MNATTEKPRRKASLKLLLGRYNGLLERLRVLEGRLSTLTAKVERLDPATVLTPQERDTGAGLDLLTVTQVSNRLSLSVRSVWRLVKHGELPEPIRYTRRMVRWPAVVIETHSGRLAGGEMPRY